MLISSTLNRLTILRQSTKATLSIAFLIFFVSNSVSYGDPIVNFVDAPGNDFRVASIYGLTISGNDYHAIFHYDVSQTSLGSNIDTAANLGFPWGGTEIVNAINGLSLDASSATNSTAFAWIPASPSTAPVDNANRISTTSLNPMMVSQACCLATGVGLGGALPSDQAYITLSEGIEPAAVPEPSAFLCLGLVGLAMVTWKKK